MTTTNAQAPSAQMLKSPTAATADTDHHLTSRVAGSVSWWGPPVAMASGLWGWGRVPGWGAVLMSAALAATAWMVWLVRLRGETLLNRPSRGATTHLPQVAATVIDRYQPLLPSGRGTHVEIEWQVTPCPHTPQGCREPVCNHSAVVPVLPEARTTRAILRFGEALLMPPSLFHFAAIREIHHLVGGCRLLAYRAEHILPIPAAFLLGYSAPNMLSAILRYVLLIITITAIKWFDEIACDRAAATVLGADATQAYFTHLDEVQKTGLPTTARARRATRFRQLARGLACPPAPTAAVRAAATRAWKPPRSD
jgi:hypothetical protein